VSLVTIYQGPTSLAVGRAHGVRQQGISHHWSMQPGLESWHSQVDLSMDCVPCIQETPQGQ